MIAQEIAAGRELDFQIALKVLGWTRQPDETQAEGWWWNNHGDGGHVPDNYSTDIAAAWTILPKFTDFRIESESEFYGVWYVRLTVRRNNGTGHPVLGTARRFEDIPRLICETALIAHDLQERLRNDELIPGVNPY